MLGLLTELALVSSCWKLLDISVFITRWSRRQHSARMKLCLAPWSCIQTAPLPLIHLPHPLLTPAAHLPLSCPHTSLIAHPRHTHLSLCPLQIPYIALHIIHPMPSFTFPALPQMLGKPLGSWDSSSQGEVRHLLGGLWVPGAAWGQGQGVSGLLRAPPAGFSSDGVHVPLVSPNPPNPWSHSASSLYLLRVHHFGEDTLTTGLLEPFRFKTEELRCFFTKELLIKPKA